MPHAQVHSVIWLLCWESLVDHGVEVAALAQMSHSCQSTAHQLSSSHRPTLDTDSRRSFDSPPDFNRRHRPIAARQYFAERPLGSRIGDFRCKARPEPGVERSESAMTPPCSSNTLATNGLSRTLCLTQGIATTRENPSSLLRAPKSTSVGKKTLSWCERYRSWWRCWRSVWRRRGSRLS